MENYFEELKKLAALDPFVELKNNAALQTSALESLKMLNQTFATETARQILQVNYSDSLKTLAATLQAQPNYISTLFSEAGNTLTAQLRETVQGFDNQFFEMFSSILDEFSSLPKERDLIKTACKTLEQFSIVTRESILHTIENAEPYAAGAKTQEYEETILPKLQGKSKEPLTRSDWIALASLLITILFGIASLLPNKEDEKMVFQGEVIIEQQTKQIELQQEENETLRALLEDCTTALEEATRQLERLDKMAEISDDSVGDIQNISDSSAQNNELDE